MSACFVHPNAILKQTSHLHRYKDDSRAAVWHAEIYLKRRETHQPDWAVGWNMASAKGSAPCARCAGGGAEAGGGGGSARLGWRRPLRRGLLGGDGAAGGGGAVRARPAAGPASRRAAGQGRPAAGLRPLLDQQGALLDRLSGCWFLTLNLQLPVCCKAPAETHMTLMQWVSCVELASFRAVQMQLVTESRERMSRLLTSAAARQSDSGLPPRPAGCAAVPTPKPCFLTVTLQNYTVTLGHTLDRHFRRQMCTCNSHHSAAREKAIYQQPSEPNPFNLRYTLSTYHQLAHAMHTPPSDPCTS